MHLPSIIAALAFGYYTDPAVPSRVAAPLVHAIDAARIPAQILVDLEAAFGWFAADVARPVLAARDRGELSRLLAEHAAVGSQARAAIVAAVQALLEAAPDALQPAALDADLRSQLGQRAQGHGAVLLATMELAATDFQDWRRFHDERPRIVVPVSEAQFALSTLVPLANAADIPLLVALLAMHAPTAPGPTVLAALVEEAHSALLRHRAAFHATLRRWDPVWSPTIDVPAWGDRRSEIALQPGEIDAIVGVMRAPPPPTAALRRALSRR